MLKNIKTNLVILVIWFIICLIIFAIASLFAAFGILNLVTNTLIIYLFGLFVFFILGFLSGNIKQEKGLYNGIILSIFVLIILMLLYFLGLGETFTLPILIKFIVFILSSGLGGIFGVNFKPLVK